MHEYDRSKTALENGVLYDTDEMAYRWGRIKRQIHDHPDYIDWTRLAQIADEIKMACHRERERREDKAA